jgi:itaconate CoA-transferase
MKPLSGILVVSVEQAVAAPLCSCRLADAGARVIKVERPEGDFARNYDQAVHGQASYFVWLNRGKESIVLDLKAADDLTMLHRVLAKADVFIQNLAPGAADRLGLDSEGLRKTYPRLITCDISGYGAGPYRDMKAYDLLIQSETGLVSVSGAPGEYGRIGVSVCDIATGLNAANGILEALMLRERTGKATGIQVSLFDSAADWMTVPYVHHQYGGKTPERVGLNHPSIAPYGGYQTGDGETIVLSIQNEQEWSRFCQHILQRPDLTDVPEFCDNHARVAHRPALDKIILAVFSAYTRTDLEHTLRAHAIAYGAVNSVEDLANHTQLRRWPMEIDGQMAQMIAPPVVRADDEGTFRSVPKLGEHTTAIMAEFGG